MKNVVIRITAAFAALSTASTAAYAEESIKVPFDIPAEEINVGTELHSPDDIVTFIVETGFTPAAEAAAEQLASARMKGMSLTLDDIDTTEVSEDVKARNEELLQTAAEELSADTSDSYIYTELFSGFTITTRYGDIDKLRNMEGVSAVYEDIIFEAGDPVSYDVDTSSTGMPWGSSEYTGKGTLVAVIDSGFELDHPYFEAAPAEVKYDEAAAAEKISNIGHGKYYSAKIPYTYDYFSSSSSDSNIASDADHGTHVAGIVGGANGVDSTGETINGVAPDAQLALMATGNGSGSSSFVNIQKALDDAYNIGADVVNMSLGTPYTDVRHSSFSALRTSISNAENAGIVVCVSSGNESRGFFNSAVEAENPDYGAEGTMAKITDTFSIASADCIEYRAELIPLTLADGTVLYGEAVKESADFTTVCSAAAAYTDCGYGETGGDFPAEVKDGIALIRRGKTSFADMNTRAVAAGAKGIILINTSDKYEAGFTGFTLPTVVVKASDGAVMAEKTNKTVSAAEKVITMISSPTGGRPSSFSSWGFTEKMELTPSITGYGGNVYSSIPGEAYGNMSGTSMSSPHLAGVSACVKQYVNENGWTSRNVSELIKSLLMTTADVIKDDNGIPYSPRQQGAGLVDLSGAVNTPVILKNTDNKTVVNLGNNIGSSFSLSFAAENLSDTAVTFDNVSVDVIADCAADGYVADGMQKLTANINTEEPVTVGANSEKSITINVSLNSSELSEIERTFKNGFYIDGFVTLSNDSVTAGIPFSGFYGDWKAVPIFDRSIYDDGGSRLISTANKIYGTFLMTKYNDTDVYLGDTTGSGILRSDHMIISPKNGDGIFDTVIPYITLMRASHGLRLSFVRDGKEMAAQTRYSTTSSGTYMQKFSPYIADYTEKNIKNLADGAYTFRMTGYFDNGDGKNAAQTYDFRWGIIVDNTAPEISTELEGNMLTVKVSDQNFLRGIKVSYTDKDGEEKTLSEPISVTETAAEKVFTLDSLGSSQINIQAFDYAYNEAEASVAAAQKDTEFDASGYATNKGTELWTATISDAAAGSSVTGLKYSVTASNGMETKTLTGSAEIPEINGGSCKIGLILKNIAEGVTVTAVNVFLE